jgi:hypothetical protein
MSPGNLHQLAYLSLGNTAEARMSDLKMFKTQGERVHVQALHAWIVLTSQVQSKKKDGVENVLITYGDLAQAMGMSAQAGRTLARPLWILGRLCLENGIPALNAIVINARELKPGKGVVHHVDRTVTEEQAAVAGFDWFSVRPPTTGMLRRIWEGIDQPQAAE